MHFTRSFTRTISQLSVQLLVQSHWTMNTWTVEQTEHALKYNQFNTHNAAAMNMTAFRCECDIVEASIVVLVCCLSTVRNMRLSHLVDSNYTQTHSLTSHYIWEKNLHQMHRMLWQTPTNVLLRPAVCYCVIYALYTMDANRTLARLTLCQTKAFDLDQ